MSYTPSIPVVEIPDLDGRYQKVQQTFIIWFAPSGVVAVFACALLVFFSYQREQLFIYALPAALGSVLGLIVAGSTIWTYVQQRAVLDATWSEHVSDRLAARDLAKQALTVSFTQNNIGNLNSGQQVMLQDDSEPIFRKGGNLIKDFWKRQFGDDEEPLALPDPPKEPLVLDWADADELVDLMLTYGASRRETMGMPLPSGKAVYSQIWAAMTKAMTKAGVAIVRSRTPTRLTTQDPAAIKQALREKFPEGLLVNPTEPLAKGESLKQTRPEKASPVQTPTYSVDSEIVESKL